MSVATHKGFNWEWGKGGWHSHKGFGNSCAKHLARASRKQGGAKGSLGLVKKCRGSGSPSEKQLSEIMWYLRPFLLQVPACTSIKAALLTRADLQALGLTLQLWPHETFQSRVSCHALGFPLGPSVLSITHSFFWVYFSGHILPTRLSVLHKHSTCLGVPRKGG